MDIKTRRMRQTASMYLGVSQRLFDTKNGDDGWVGALNAALAIEVFIKSHLAYTDKTVPKKHGLIALFSRLKRGDQNHLIKEYKAKSEGTQLSGNLKKDLNKFNNLFVDARYIYDEGSIKSTGNDVLICANILSAIIYSMQGS
ncbi:MAG: HEPN domain-containing protein [Shewanella xiamenensis]